MLHLLPLAIVAAGGYYLVRLRAFFLLHPKKTVASMLAHGREEGKGFFMRTSLALAGTLGVGNITGVAAGIYVGGAGSVFWLLASALFAAPLKYAEAAVVLSKREARGKGYGMLVAVRESTRHFGGTLAAIYAILSVMLAFFMGSALQLGAVCESLTCSEYKAFVPAVMGVYIILLIFCIFGSSVRICKATSVLIPIAMIVYTILCISVLFLRFSMIPRVVCMIFKDAFSSRALLGGALGTALRSPVREGFLRGLLSNEAGAGTSAYAHAKGQHSSPHAEGLLGMLEVFFDTVVLCMLTALAVLLSVEDVAAVGGGMPLVLTAFTGTLGAWSAVPLLLSVFLFALSTSVCWFEYGRCALTYLTPKGQSIYFVLYLSFAVLGAKSPTLRLIPICDGVLFFLTLITLFVLLKNRAAVCAEADRIFKTEKAKPQPHTAAVWKIKDQSSLRR